MRDVYTITRWDNGWTVDVKTNDGLKDYTGVSEDPYWVEDTHFSRAQSLAELLYNTFEQFISTDERDGMVIEIEESEESEESEEEQTQELEGDEENDSE
jgi:hypothetical protein